MEVRQMQSQLSGEGPDPIVKLKETEIQQRAQSDAARIQLDTAKLDMEKQKAAEVQRANQARITSQENIALLRADLARERINQVNQQQGAQNAS
jgi:formylmethanofuran dehydrogenase subunit E